MIWVVYGEENKSDVDFLKEILGGTQGSSSNDQTAIDSKTIEELRKIIKETDKKDLNFNNIDRPNIKIAAALEGYQVNLNLNEVKDLSVKYLLELSSQNNNNNIVNAKLKEKVSTFDSLEKSDKQAIMRSSNKEVQKALIESSSSKDDDFKEVCKLNQVACLTYANQVNLEKIIEEGVIKEDDLINCYSDIDCRDNVEKGDSNLIDKFNTESCTGIFNTATFCLFSSKINERDLFNDALNKNFQKTSQDYLKVEINDFNLETGKFGDCEEYTCFKCTGETQGKCLDQLKNACNGDNACYKEGEKVILSRSFHTKESLDNYNNEIAKNFLEQIGVNSDCENNCLEKAREHCENNDNYKCKFGLDTLENKQLVETGMAYNIISAILNPDADALKAARLFGFEANYEAVPTILKDPFASQICLSKVKGYLNKEVVNQGGVTRYSGNASNLQIVGDIRAQRTALTPDNKTMVTFSYFVKAIDKDLKYVVGLTYVKDGQTQKDLLFNEVQSLSLGSSKSDFGSKAVQINSSENNLKNFKIHLISTDNNKNHQFTLTYDVVLINTGSNYYSPIINGQGNVVGNQQVRDSQEQEQNQETIEDYFLGLI